MAHGRLPGGAGLHLPQGGAVRAGGEGEGGDGGAGQKEGHGKAPKAAVLNLCVE